MTYMSEPEHAMVRKAKGEKANSAELSQTAKRITRDLIPEWCEFFLKKNAGYGDMSSDLGPRAQFVDINRKAGKLRRALWEGKDIGDEKVREVAMDLIGHCFLLIDLLDDESKPGW